MEHSFNVDVATKYGVHSAILLNNIAFWCAKNKANGTHEHDGHFWTYNSKAAFAELFPYMTARQIDYALSRLIDDGILVTGNYNANAYDRTLWYAVTKKGYSILQNCEMENTQLSNGSANFVEPIPDKKPDENRADNKPNKKKGRKKEPDISFDQLIDGYTENEELREALRAYIQMREMIRKPLTNYGFEQVFKKLNKLAGADEAKIDIVNQSVMNSWQGLFPLKEQNNMGRRMNNGTDAGRSSENSGKVTRKVGTWY